MLLLGSPSRKLGSKGVNASSRLPFEGSCRPNGRLRGSVNKTYNFSYNSENIPRARKLRREMTPQERHLWYCFLKDYPLKIYRQKTIGCYILDFYCSKAKLAIEIDGGQHYIAQTREYDRKRTNDLNQQGIMVLRFTNHDIDVHFDTVCMETDMEIKECMGVLPERET